MATKPKKKVAKKKAAKKKPTYKTRAEGRAAIARGMK